MITLMGFGIDITHLRKMILYAMSSPPAVLSNLEVHPDSAGDSLLITMWSIWHRRNDIIWNDGPRDPTSVVRRASSLFTDWKLSRNLSSPPSNPAEQIRSSSWTPPRIGFLKCNVDATVSESSSMAGYGAVIRNHNGVFVSAKASPINFLPPVRECEALAIRDALQWVSNRDDKFVIFETDAKIVVDAVYDSFNDESEFGDIISDIRGFLNYNRNFSIHAIGRQANELAHLTARHSHILTCPFIFHEIPDFLKLCMNNYCTNLPINEMNVTQVGDGNAKAH